MARLTEQQIQAMRPLIVGVPEHGRTRAQYPALRRRRLPAEGVLDGIPDDAPLALPPSSGQGRFNAKLQTFQVRDVTATEMAVAVSQRFTGPAYIADGWLQLNLAGSAAAVPAYFAIIAAPDSSGGGASQTRRVIPGINVFEVPASADDSGNFLTDQGGIPGAVSLGGGNHNPFPIGRFIELDQFWLKFVCYAAAGGGAIAVGWVRVIENIAPNFNVTPY